MKLTKKQEIIGDIRGHLMRPTTALHVIYESCKCNKVPKDFVKSAMDDLILVVKCLELLNPEQRKSKNVAKDTKISQEKRID